jgi:AcrR family transcriptional regulator
MPAAQPNAPVAKRAYHHGDLRRALLEAAWRLVTEKGLAALTLRELARAAGVSHAAPYHHFPTRTALLDALAEEGFTGLDRAMAQATAEGAPGDPAAGAANLSSGAEAAERIPTRSASNNKKTAVNPAPIPGAADPADAGEQLFRIGRDYVDFACALPEQLEVMFRPRHGETEGPPPQALAAIGAQAFARLADAVRACQQQGLAPAGDSAALALSAWSLVHGFASLWNQGQLGTLIADGSDFERLRDQLLRNLQAGWQATARDPGANAGDPEAPRTV